jgi:hypothetical protein
MLVVAIVDGTMIILLLAWAKVKHSFNYEVDVFLDQNPSNYSIFLVMMLYLLTIYYYALLITLLLVLFAYVFKTVILSQFAKMANGEYPVSVEAFMRRITLYVTSRPHIIYNIVLFIVLSIFVYVASIFLVQKDQKTDRKKQVNMIMNYLPIIIIGTYLLWILWLCCRS